MPVGIFSSFDSDSQSHIVNASLDFNESHFDPIFWDFVPKTGKLNRSRTNERSYALFAMVIFGTAANIFVLVTCMKSTSLMSHRTTYLVLSLSVADLLVSGGVMGLDALLPYNNMVGTRDPAKLWRYCAAWYFFNTFSCTASSLNICAIAVDRYMYISRPLHYDLTMTKKRMIIALIAIWLVSAGIASFIFSQDGLDNAQRQNETMESDNTTRQYTHCTLRPRSDYSVAVVVIVLILPACIVVTLYARILSIVRQKKDPPRTSIVGSLSERSSGDPPLSTLGSALVIERPEGRPLPGTGKSPDTHVTFKKPSHGEVDDPSELVYGSSTDAKVVQKRSFTWDNQDETLFEAQFGSSTDARVPHKHTFTWDNQEQTFLEVRFGSVSYSDVFSEGKEEIIDQQQIPRPEPYTTETLQRAFRRSTAAISAQMATGVNLCSGIFLQDQKAVLVLCLVVGTYVMCWMPFAIATLLNVFIGLELSVSTREILLWMGYSNSCWNPVIYAGFNQMFRRSVGRSCRRIKRNIESISPIHSSSHKQDRGASTEV